VVVSGVISALCRFASGTYLDCMNRQSADVSAQQFLTWQVA